MDRRLPRKLVATLREKIEALPELLDQHRLLQQLPVINHRAETRPPEGTPNVYDPPGRVRLMTAPPGHGFRHVVLKLVHGGVYNQHAARYLEKTGEERPAHGTISFIHHVVALNQHGLDVNEKPIEEERSYSLRKPWAYPLNHEIVAMAPSYLPNVTEMLSGDETTERGLRKLEKLQKYGVTEEMLQQAAKQAERHTGLSPSNLACHSIRNGKIVFIPRIDLF